MNMPQKMDTCGIAVLEGCEGVQEHTPELVETLSEQADGRLSRRSRVCQVESNRFRLGLHRAPPARPETPLAEVEQGHDSDDEPGSASSGSNSPRQELPRLDRALLEALPGVALLQKRQTREIVASNATAEKVGAVPGTRCFESWAGRQEPCPWCLAPGLWESGQAQHGEVPTSEVAWDAHWIPLSGDLYLHYAFDPTERQRMAEDLALAREAAEAANRLKREFLANMSHEMRTPLTAILGFSELLDTAPLTEPEQRQFLTLIRSNGEALLRLIDDILELSRVEADRLPVEKHDHPLQPILDEVLATATAPASHKGLRLEVERCGPMPEMIHTDLGRLRQILVNLMSNAVKFTEHGEVRLTLRSLPAGDGKRRLQFAVSDTGVGIPTARIGELFQAFMQVDGTHTRRYGGTGLGLAISKRLAQELGGDIEVTSSLGQGSTFTLTIDGGSGRVVAEPSASPAMPPAVGHSPQAESRPAPSVREPLPALQGRLLFAEDIPAIQLVVRHVMRKLDVEVEFAEDGHRACAMAEQSRADGRPYDLILMDIQMPGRNGYEATRWLRERGWPGPIVALTAHALQGDRERCLDAGCDDYLTKPINIMELQRILTRYLQARGSNAIRTGV